MTKIPLVPIFFTALVSVILGCGARAPQVQSPQEAKPVESVESALPQAASHTAKPPCDCHGQSPTTANRIGKPAPDFTLSDIDGNQVKLSDYKGKIVVLEWFNPKCPFIKTAHERRFSLQGFAAEAAAQNVVWLAINSEKPGAKGHTVEENREGKQLFGIDYPILLDKTGEVGQKYGALRTPHMFIIDAEGVLVYDGAVDNTAGGDLDDADPPPALNFVKAALKNIGAAEPVKILKTTPWG